jgi:hypothetical protein
MFVSDDFLMWLHYLTHIHTHMQAHARLHAHTHRWIRKRMEERRNWDRENRRRRQEKIGLGQRELKYGYTCLWEWSQCLYTASSIFTSLCPIESFCLHAQIYQESSILSRLWKVTIITNDHLQWKSCPLCSYFSLKSVSLLLIHQNFFSSIQQYRLPWTF